MSGSGNVLYISDWGRNAILELTIDPSSKQVTRSRTLISGLATPMGVTFTPVNADGETF